MMRRRRERQERRWIAAAARAAVALITTCADFQGGPGDLDLIDAAAGQIVTDVLADPPVAQRLLWILASDLATLYRLAADAEDVDVGLLLSTVALNIEARFGS